MIVYKNEWVEVSYKNNMFVVAYTKNNVLLMFKTTIIIEDYLSNELEDIINVLKEHITGTKISVAIRTDYLEVDAMLYGIHGAIKIFVDNPTEDVITDALLLVDASAKDESVSEVMKKIVEFYRMHVKGE